MILVVSWHPVYEDFFTSGGSDGAIKFWNVGYVYLLWILDYDYCEGAEINFLQ